MNLNGKLQKWVDAGLISSAQRESIITHEREFSSNRWKTGIASSGLLSVLLGISLIVASNWQYIPDNVKLGGHFALNLVLALFVWLWRDMPSRKIHREGVLFALWGLTLTLIALIGQVFQLGGHAYEGVRLWFWLTTPMILLFAQGAYVARLWALAFLLYVPYDLVSTAWDMTSNWDIRKAVLIGTGTLLPLGGWLLGSLPAVTANRPAIANALRRICVFLALLTASVAGLEFYDHYYYDYSLFIPAFFAASMIGLRFALNHMPLWSTDQKYTIDLLCLAGLFTTIPFFTMAESDLWSMLYFIAFWSLAAHIWQQQGQSRYVGHAVTLISLRLFIGFLEIFGSMMLSGFGFIIIGGVLMGLAYATRKIRNRLKGAA